MLPLREKCFQRMFSFTGDSRISTAAEFRDWEIAWHLGEGVERLILGGTYTRTEAEEGHGSRRRHQSTRRAHTIPKEPLLFGLETLAVQAGVPPRMPTRIVPLCDEDATRIRKYLYHLGSSGLRLFEKPSNGGMGVLATRHFMRYSYSATCNEFVL